VFECLTNRINYYLTTILKIDYEYIHSLNNTFHLFHPTTLNITFIYTINRKMLRQGKH